MKSFISKTYLIFWAALFIFMMYLVFAYRLDFVDRDNEDDGVKEISFAYKSAEDESAPLDIVETHTWVVDGVDSYSDHIIFYSAHANVKAYLNGVLVYSMETIPTPMAGKSPGCGWNDIPLLKTDNGSTLTIDLYPVYDISIGYKPVFYCGDEADIIFLGLRRDALSLILSLLTIIMGVFYMFYDVLVNRKGIILNRLFMLGAFAVNVGVWKLFDTEITKILFRNIPAMSQVGYVSLMLMFIPFMLFLKEIFLEAESKVWYYCCILSFVHMLVCVSLQIFGIMDMKESLVIAHLMIVFALCVTLYFAISEIRKYGFSIKLKRNLIYVSLCFLGAGIDIAVYYLSGTKRVTLFAMMMFMLYVIVNGYNNIKDAQRLMNIGIKASKYRELAYHDQLTGLHNRTAYNKDLSELEVPDGHAIIMMDANDLKKCNDSFGHDVGDIYIFTVGNIIDNIFKDIGRCYRIGGDEFCVLVNSKSYTEAIEHLDKFKETVASSQAIPGIVMQIACGVALFDRFIDRDIFDTVRRADRKMYEEKYKSKNKTAEKS